MFGINTNIINNFTLSLTISINAEIIEIKNSPRINFNINNNSGYITEYGKKPPSGQWITYEHKDYNFYLTLKFQEDINNNNKDNKVILIKIKKDINESTKQIPFFNSKDGQIYFIEEEKLIEKESLYLINFIVSNGQVQWKYNTNNKYEIGHKVLSYEREINNENIKQKLEKYYLKNEILSTSNKDTEEYQILDSNNQQEPMLTSQEGKFFNSDQQESNQESFEPQSIATNKTPWYKGQMAISFLIGIPCAILAILGIQYYKQ